MSYRAITRSDGDIVYRRGDPGDCMYLIQEGTVEMLAGGEDGTRMVLFERGDFFGENAVLEQVKREHTLRATEDTRLIQIDGSGLAHMLRRNPEITIRMVRKLAKRLAQSETRLGVLLAGDFGAGEPMEETLGTLPQTGTLIFDGEEAQEFVVAGEGVAIGRADPLSGIVPDVDLTPLDPQLTTSRRHAALTIETGIFSLVEVRATNGTFVDGRRLSPEEPARLLGGERLVFGGVALRFELDT